MKSCESCIFVVMESWRQCLNPEDHRFGCDCPEDRPEKTYYTCRRYPEPIEVDGDGCGEHRSEESDG